MGKNKLHTRNPGKSGNPIYKKAGAGFPRKAKQKVKPVKTNLKQLKFANKEAIASLNKNFGSFHEALQSKQEESPKTKRVKREEPPPVNVDDAAEDLSKL